MTEAPAFFVPEATPGDEESAYAALSAFCGRPVQNVAQRIYSITFVHDGEEWQATVAELLRGIRRQVRRSHGKKIESKIPLTDGAMVLAIFSGTPFVVSTNYRFTPSVRSAWENPFYTGQPKSITYFRGRA